MLLHSFLGIPLALWCARSKGFLVKIVSFLITLPLVFPPIALGYMLLMLLGRGRGIGNAIESLFGIRFIFSQAGVFLAAFIAGLPLVVRPISAAFESEELISLEEASRVFGCSPFRAFLFVTLPLARASIVSGLLLGVARAFGEVGITMMLGGNIAHKTSTLSLEVFNRVSHGDFDAATKLCMLLAVMGLIIYIALEKFHVKKEF